MPDVNFTQGSRMPVTFVVFSYLKVKVSKTDDFDQLFFSHGFHLSMGQCDILSLSKSIVTSTTEVTEQIDWSEPLKSGVKKIVVFSYLKVKVSKTDDFDQLFFSMASIFRWDNVTFFHCQVYCYDRGHRANSVMVRSQ